MMDKTVLFFIVVYTLKNCIKRVKRIPFSIEKIDLCSIIIVLRRPMKKSDDYLKIVEWSEGDQCYVGTCPGLLTGGGIYGEDETAVYKDLCRYATEWIEIMERDGIPLPEATARKEYSGKFVLRMEKSLHKELAVRSINRGVSLNSYILGLIKEKLGLQLD